MGKWIPESNTIPLLTPLGSDLPEEQVMLIKAFEADACEAAVFKIDFESPAVVASFSMEPQTTCLPYTVNFFNWGDSASFQWNFGDADTWLASQDIVVTHTYNAPGDYTVSLAAYDIESCNIHDTLKLNVHVPDISADLDMAWEYSDSGLCDSSTTIFAEFTGSGADSLQWHFGGNFFYYNSVAFELDDPGNYSLQRVAFDESCQYADTLEWSFQIGPPVEVDSLAFSGLPCAPADLSFAVYSNAADLLWMYGDGSVSDTLGQHIYHSPGVYTITLVAAGNGCIGVDTSATQIEIFPLPVVSWTLPDTACTSDSPWVLTGVEPSGGAYSGEGVVDGIFYPLLAGTGEHYLQYAYTDEHGCTDVAEVPLVVTICAFISTENFSELMIYPNPANDQLMLEGGGLDMVTGIRMVDLTGRCCQINVVKSGNQWIVDTSHLARGCYFLTINDLPGTLKVIVSR